MNLLPLEQIYFLRLDSLSGGPHGQGKQTESAKVNSFYPLYTDRLFHYCMLDKSISQFRDIGSILSLLFHL